MRSVAAIAVVLSVALMTWFGRAFELQDGTIVLPCDFCGAPCFEPEAHTCPGLLARILEEMEES